MGMTIIIALVTFVVGGLLVWFVMRVLMKSRYDAVIREAEKESEVMKQKKLLDGPRKLNGIARFRKRLLWKPPVTQMERRPPLRKPPSWMMLQAMR